MGSFGYGVPCKIVSVRGCPVVNGLRLLGSEIHGLAMVFRTVNSMAVPCSVS